MKAPAHFTAAVKVSLTALVHMVGEESLSQRFTLLTLLQGSVTEGLGPLGAGKPLDFCHWETERDTHTQGVCCLTSLCITFPAVLKSRLYISIAHCKTVGLVQVH